MEPKNVILHIGTNDAPYKNSGIILENIVQLKSYIESRLLNANVYISRPLRFDNPIAGRVNDITFAK